MSLLHLVHHCIVRACMLCGGAVQSWQSMGSTRVAVKEVHLFAIWAPSLVAVFEPLLIRFPCEGVVSLVRDAFFGLCFQQDLISMVDPPTSTCNSPRPDFLFATPIWFNLLRQCAQSQFTHFSERSNSCSCVPDFNSCSTVWTLFANPAKAPSSLSEGAHHVRSHHLLGGHVPVSSAYERPVVVPDETHQLPHSDHVF